MEAAGDPLEAAATTKVVVVATTRAEAAGINNKVKAVALMVAVVAKMEVAAGRCVRGTYVP